MLTNKIFKAQLVWKGFWQKEEKSCSTKGRINVLKGRSKCSIVAGGVSLLFCPVFFLVLKYGENALRRECSCCVREEKITPGSYQKWLSPETLLRICGCFTESFLPQPCYHLPWGRGSWRTGVGPQRQQVLICSREQAQSREEAESVARQSLKEWILLMHAHSSDFGGQGAGEEVLL